MISLRLHIATALLLLVFLVSLGSAGPPAAVRYRVEQTIRLESTSAAPRSKTLDGLPGERQPVSVGEARLRWLLEQRLEEGVPPRGTWRVLDVVLQDLRQEPESKRATPGVQALAAGLARMRRLEGKTFSGYYTELPVFPLGEQEPAWLTRWLRWAQVGSFAGVEQDPVEWNSGERDSPAYQVRWVRSGFRQVPCHVQQARWTAPARPAPGSLPADLEAQGVEARTYFSATSLEWVARRDPHLIYAERSAARETFWRVEEAAGQPGLRRGVFRLRLSVTVRVERVP